MALKIRLSRRGRKKIPYYKVIVTDSRNPRDGKFLEQVGTYDPLLSGVRSEKFKLVEDRIKYWISVGAKPTDTIASYLKSAGML